MERVQSRLAHAKLSKTFWAETLMTMMYVIYRSPSTHLDGDITQRVWTDKDVSYRHLKVFDILSYVHIAKYKREKVDLNTQPCIFLGYGDNKFGYRMWNLAEKKGIWSCDIVFMDDKTIADWESEKKVANSESTDRDRLDESRIHLVRIRMPVEDHREPVGFEEGLDVGTG